MELRPKFYKAVWPYCNSDSYFRNPPVHDREKPTIRNQHKGRDTATETRFQKRRQSSCMWKVFFNTTSYIPRASDVAVLSKHLDQLTSLKTEVKKLKNEVAW